MIRRNNCATCNGTRLHKIIDLGMMPNANNLVAKEDLSKVKLYPLEYYWCANCNLLQQIEMADKEDLFNSNYTYITGVSKTIVEHYKKLAFTISKKVNAKDFAIVIASNDGTEIESLTSVGFGRVIGVEPSSNLADISKQKGNETINAFFSEELATELVPKYGKADVIIANNVLAHVPNPKDVLLGIKKMLKTDGCASIEVHWLRSLVKDVEIDTLYAEHYFVWTVRAMNILASSCGLAIEDIEFLPSPQAGSLRYWLRHSETLVNRSATEQVIQTFISQEIEEGIQNLDRMLQLNTNANIRKEKLVKLVKQIRKDGKEIALWTAPAKMSTILNFCNFTSDDIKCAYDGSRYKMNKYIPKANIPVLDEALLRDDKLETLPAEYMIIGAWNLMDLAKEKLNWYILRGGLLINPLTVEVFS